MQVQLGRRVRIDRVDEAPELLICDTENPCVCATPMPTARKCLAFRRGDTSRRGTGCATRSRTSGLTGSETTLTAAPGTARLAASANAPALLYNGASPGPTLHGRRGDRARIRLVNALDEPTTVHWHGLVVPEIADGHARRAIDAGATFDYEFDVVQRAGTYRYHPHAHHRTAAQIQRGLADFFIVRDAEEDALRLPGGDREILLLLQDRGGDASAFDYAATETDDLVGMLRDVPYGNGVRRPRLDVAGARYRFRVLNASRAHLPPRLRRCTLAHRDRQ